MSVITFPAWAFNRQQPDRLRIFQEPVDFEFLEDQLFLTEFPAGVWYDVFRLELEDLLDDLQTYEDDTPEIDDLISAVCHLDIINRDQGREEAQYYIKRRLLEALRHIEHPRTGALLRFASEHLKAARHV